MRRMIISLTLAAFAAVPAASLAKGGPAGGGAAGGGGGGGAAPAARCATLTVTNNGQTVREFKMPPVDYTLANCGTEGLSATVTITESPGFLSALCPSPTAPPVDYALGAHQKLTARAPVFRGPCGLRSPTSTDLVDSSRGWQGHNLQLTVTDDATGAILSTGFFSWQDAQPRV
jgi:hypothetical protein